MSGVEWGGFWGSGFEWGDFGLVASSGVISSGVVLQWADFEWGDFEWSGFEAGDACGVNKKFLKNVGFSL